MYSFLLIRKAGCWRIANTLFLLVFLSGCFVPWSASASSRQLGDLDGDGKLTIFDLELLINHLNGTVPLATALLPYADINGDAFIDQSDLQGLVNLILGIPLPLRSASLEPGNGATEVGVTVRPKMTFPRPIDTSTLNSNNFYASFAGMKLPATIVPSGDGTFAWLFLNPAMPNASQITVTLDGSTITNKIGLALDVDGDGVPGGGIQFNFSTVSVAPLANTFVSSRVVDPGPDLIPRTGDDVMLGLHGYNYLLPIRGVKVYVLGLESNFTFTDANGQFTLTNMPVGDVKVVLDGRTAVNPPSGYYFPEMVMDTTFSPGITNGVMTIRDANGNVMRDANGVPIQALAMYLPRIASNALQTVSTSVTNMITLHSNAAYDLTAEQQKYLTVQIQPNSIVGMNGQSMGSAQVGISVVPPSVVSDMLPPGLLQHTFDITVQAMGVATFSTPATMTFPNVFGTNALPGSKLNFLSFDHTTGRLIIDGTGTVSSDGLYVTTDPGTGVTHPGWHGLAPPGSPTGGGGGDPPTPPLDCQTIQQILDNDYQSKKGTTDAALAHQIDCLAMVACENLDSWAGGFVHDVLSDIARQTERFPVALNIPNWVPFGNEIAAVLAGFGYHFPFQLLPVFMAHCGELNESDHNNFFDHAVVPCFSNVVNSGELAPWAGALAQQIVPVSATALRETIMALCFLAGNYPNESIVPNPPGRPILPPPPTSKKLYSTEVAAVGSLRIESGTNFFIGVGANYPLRVSKRLPNGNEIDLSSSSSGTLYYVAVADQSVVVDANGVVSVMGTSSPFESMTPDLYIIAKNGADVGIGQFAVTDRDTSGDLIVDSWKIKLGIPLSSTNFSLDLEKLRQFLSNGKNSSTPHRLKAPYLYAIEDLSSGYVIRGNTSPEGTIPSAFLAPSTGYRLWLYQLDSALLGCSVFTSSASGSTTILPSVSLSKISDADYDNDGLSDATEFVIGTDPNKYSTAGDGISDGEKVAQGLDPLSGAGFATGIIASLPLLGFASDLTIIGATDGSGAQTAYVACGPAGLSIINVSQFKSPVLLGQLNLPGTANSVSVDATFQIAVVAANSGGLHFVDVSNPLIPRLLSTIPTNASAVRLIAGVAYAAVGNTIQAFDLLTAQFLQTLPLGSAAITDLANEGFFLYTMDSANTLRVIDLSGDVMATRGSVILPNGGGKLFVGGGIGYIAATSDFYGGFLTASLSNPDHPVLIKDSSASASSTSLNPYIAVNGSGLGLLLSGGGRGAIASAQLYNVSNPANTAAFLTLYPLPADPYSVAIGAGIAFVADGNAGLQIINYKSFDALGVAPTITLSNSFTILNATNGIAVEGNLARVLAVVTDDVQVRNVEFYVDGALVSSDQSFPFEYLFVAPAISASKTNFTLQAKAFDTGGNSTLTPLITVQLTPDTSPPRLRRSYPGANSVFDSVTNIFVYFNKPLNGASLDAASFSLIFAGPDHRLGTADDQPVIGGNVAYLNTLNAAALTFANALPYGLYRATLSTNLSDASGNALTNSLSWTFWVLPGGPDGDADHDDLSNADEIARGTDPLNPDTDGDGWPDGVEVSDDKDPLDPKSHPIITAVAGPPIQVNLAGPDETGSTSAGTLVASPPVQLICPGLDESGSPGSGTTVANPPVMVTFPGIDETGTVGIGTTLAFPMVLVIFPGLDETGAAGTGTTIAYPPLNIVFPGQDETGGFGNGTFLAFPGLQIIFPGLDETGYPGSGTTLARPPVQVRIQP